MNDYIILDGFKYRTTHKQWQPMIDRPVVIKKLMSGARNATFGPAMKPIWQGAVRAVAANPESGFGTIDDLRATYMKLSSLAFQDHYGTAYTVVLDRRVNEASFTPKWDGTENKFEVNLTVVAL
jgi:hypothetical protein